jgi:hypothetical protein
MTVAGQGLLKKPHEALSKPLPCFRNLRVNGVTRRLKHGLCVHREMHGRASAGPSRRSLLVPGETMAMSALCKEWTPTQGILR